MQFNHLDYSLFLVIISYNENVFILVEELIRCTVSSYHLIRRKGGLASHHPFLNPMEDVSILVWMNNCADDTVNDTKESS